MRNRGSWTYLTCVNFMVALGCGLGTAQGAERPTIDALRVPDGTIIIDGRDDDWRQFGAALDGARTAAAGADHIAFAMTERGQYSGPEDGSMTCWTATDGVNLYVMADVHDQVLINDAGPDDPYDGDDFEIFLDANPPEARFAEKRNENARQLIFIPAHINTRIPGTFIWQAAQNPGVLAASRLRPWGYTIEVAIPKALVPNWKAHPDLDGIGFDVQANDADAPGVDRYHPALKNALFLLRPGIHFMSPQGLGLLRLAALLPAVRNIAVKMARPLTTAQLLDALKPGAGVANEILAQGILDAIDSPDASRVAAAAATSGVPGARKAGSLLLAKRPGLEGPIEAIRTQVTQAASDADYDMGTRIYQLIALAQRRALPIVDWFGIFPRVADAPTRLTIVWAAGINGDRAAVPALALLTGDLNLRIRTMAALSLGLLGDMRALPTLAAMAKNDAHQYGRAQATLAIEQIDAHK